MSEKNTTQKEKSSKSKRSETKTVGGVYQVHKTKGQGCMLHLWTDCNGKWVALWAFYPKIGGRLVTVFP